MGIMTTVMPKKLHSYQDRQCLSAQCHCSQQVTAPEGDYAWDLQDTEDSRPGGIFRQTNMSASSQPCGPQGGYNCMILYF